VKFETPPAQLLATVSLEVIGQFSLFPPWSRSVEPDRREPVQQPTLRNFGDLR